MISGRQIMKKRAIDWTRKVDPTPEEIKSRCEEIQSNWASWQWVQRESRSKEEPTPWNPPVYKEDQLSAYKSKDPT